MEAPFACKVCLFITMYKFRLTKHLAQWSHVKGKHELGREPTNIIRRPSRGFTHLFKVDETEVEKKKREERKSWGRRRRKRRRWRKEEGTEGGGEEARKKRKEESRRERSGEKTAQKRGSRLKETNQKGKIGKQKRQHRRELKKRGSRLKRKGEKKQRNERVLADYYRMMRWESQGRRRIAVESSTVWPKSKQWLIPANL